MAANVGLKKRAESRKEESSGSERASALDYFDLLSKGGSKTVTVTGATAKAPGMVGPRGCIPILWCLCVHDSPDNPCPCNGPIVWLPEWIAQSAGPTGRMGFVNGAKQPLASFTIDASSKIYVDASVRLGGGERSRVALQRDAAGDLKPVKAEIIVPRYLPIQVGMLSDALELISGDDRLTTMAKQAPGPLGWVVAAFKAGWEIGEFIDEETGASDALADWLYETFGPWGDWF
ncbi:MAG: hypothetical protein AVDCRST_MAG93-1577 [uncultured Chloroflexia bacterium]|uniref:Uncharacterized protein n=1 Tax=uncultured Chloroflexia bacterium TaxID=1672391 RepID=A0A6J4ICF2_9CHLR|nr:MAG: hypothetical protein AVDCRST_MAG93-1577 [uncultured Chloroflexia bacterium]